ncbi:hypothetical protein CSUB8523_0429 [Campylobacter subantarcticus LMG 24377]|nr:hypothetical protein CSUB8523_0429 [Campylobacter subantarcticus LMG 24377]
MDLYLDQMAITKPHKADMILGLEDGIKKLKKKRELIITEHYISSSTKKPTISLMLILL